jgi:6-phosphogluconate dehydrogenase
VQEIQAATQEQLDSVENGNNQFFAGKIASIIFQQAVMQIPEHQFCLEFWKIYRQFSNTEKLQEEVLSVIQTQFSHNEEAQAFLCRLPLTKFTIVEESDEFLQSLHQCIKAFQQALEAHPTPFMYSQFVDFYRQLLNNSSIPSLVC